MGYLLDTNAVSALAPTKNATPRSAIDWLHEHSGELFLSAVTVAEIQAGVAEAARKGARRKAELLAAWLQALLALYADRILPLDIAVGRETGVLLDRAVEAGVDPGFEDAVIAATAHVNQLTLVTANAKHFRVFRVFFQDLPT